MGTSQTKEQEVKSETKQVNLFDSDEHIDLAIENTLQLISVESKTYKQGLTKSSSHFEDSEVEEVDVITIGGGISGIVASKAYLNSTPNLTESP